MTSNLVKSLLTSGRGFLTWQLSPPTRTILGMRGRGNSKTESILDKQNAFLKIDSRQTFLSQSVLNHFLLQIFGVIRNLRLNSTCLYLSLCAIHTQSITQLMHNICTVTLAARCQTLLGLQQCPLPPPRIHRLCGQIARTITCTSEVP